MNRSSLAQAVRAVVGLAVVSTACPWTSAAAPPQQQPLPRQGVDQPASGAPLTYQAALDLAMARSLGLAAVMRQRAIREAEVRIAGQYPNPDFSFEASRDAPHEVLSLGFPLEFGKRGRRIALAREQVALADLDVEAARRAVRKSLRQAFYGLLSADERVRDAEAVRGIAQRVRETANARFTEGAAPQVEVMEADLGVARAEADLELARGTRLAVQAELNGLLNQPPGQPVAVVGDLASAPPLASLDAALQLMAASNVDLLRIDREIAIEQRHASVLRAERFPTPTISVGGVFNAPEEFRAGMSGGVSLAIPLFSRNQGELAQSSATVSQLQAEREAVRRSLEASLTAAWARVQAQRRQVEVYRNRLLPTATEIEALVEESYKAGRSPVLAVLEAQRNLREVRREYQQALADFQAAVAEVEEMIGVAIQ
jgi:cobalt-zinc-cadmium efflux system outer membrane protein